MMYSPEEAEAAEIANKAMANTITAYFIVERGGSVKTLYHYSRGISQGISSGGWGDIYGSTLTETNTKD